MFELHDRVLYRPAVASKASVAACAGDARLLSISWIRLQGYVPEADLLLQVMSAGKMVWFSYPSAIMLQ